MGGIKGWRGDDSPTFIFISRQFLFKHIHTYIQIQTFKHRIIETTTLLSDANTTLKRYTRPVRQFQPRHMSGLEDDTDRPADGRTSRLPYARTLAACLGRGFGRLRGSPMLCETTTLSTPLDLGWHLMSAKTIDTARADDPVDVPADPGHGFKVDLIKCISFMCLGRNVFSLCFCVGTVIYR